MKKTMTIILAALTIVFAVSFINNNPKTVKAEYNHEDGELRGVWMTPITGDLKAYESEASFKSEMNGIFDILEYYNMNAIFYHVRHHNNALYKSELNPVSSYFAKVDFDEFDPLAWLIDEAHRRGFEFHAWFNPYRLGNSYVGDMPSINPASNPANILTNPSNSALTILNPGLPHVRDFVVDTILEVIENYPVDAVHFDDYFYTNLGANGSTSGDNTILNEPDQSTFVKYGTGYNTNSASSKADWRREQVNLLIEALSVAIKDYNENNNRYVQFGISPTGIYKNGNGAVTYDASGKAITNGSATRGQTHYSSYLFADTVKWINEGWLDYILPQSYWATDHPIASYNEVMGWWDKVLKNLDVNLYSGIGIYMADNSNTYSWLSDPNQLVTQFNFLETLNNVSGTSMYALKHIMYGYSNASNLSGTQFKNGANSHFTTKTVLPILKSFDPIYLPSVENFTNSNGVLSWNKLDDAKFYYIYQSEGEVKFTKDEIIGVTSNLNFETNDKDMIYNYGVKPLSHSNHLGEGKTTQDSKIAMVSGASIRTNNVDNQALRFYANLNDGINASEQGFYIIEGEASKIEVLNAIENNQNTINGNSLEKVKVNEKDSNGLYSVVVENINNNLTRYTVFAYYVKDGVINLSDNKAERSVGEVALRMIQAGDGNNITNAIRLEIEPNANHLGINAFGVYGEIDGIYETNHFILREEFIKDWNSYFNTTWNNLPASTFFAHASSGIPTGEKYNISNANIYKFFNSAAFKNKWGFLLDFLKSVDGTVHTTRQINAIQGDGTLSDGDTTYDLWQARHVSHSIANFFNQEHQVGGYTAINFTQIALYKDLIDFNNQIIFNLDKYTLISK
ncbi:MAG TPA: family 10 glycosylhydrolase [Acholeplasmataceae bacterium]|nr:family 10 glycosylhydrolase [Acholeplasmataceae bacterium]